MQSTLLWWGMEPAPSYRLRHSFLIFFTPLSLSLLTYSRVLYGQISVENFNFLPLLLFVWLQRTLGFNNTAERLNTTIVKNLDITKLLLGSF